MPQFVYEAQNAAGQLITGKLQSPSQRDAIRKLNELRLLPLRIVLQQTNGSALKARVSSAQLARTYHMVADLLDSGMPLLKSLELVAGQAAHAALASMLTEITTKVADGTTLAAALAAYPNTFDDLTCNMVRAGEEGGFLEESLRRIAILHERRATLTSNLIGALAYPAFLMVTGIVVVTGMIAFFVPKFEPLFDRLRASGQLPWATTALLSLSSLLRNHGWWLACLAVAAVMMLSAWLRSESGRLRFDQWKLRIKFLGVILTGAALSVYCRVLGTLLSNGVPLLDALRIAQGTTGNRALQQVVKEAAVRVSAGGTLADNLMTGRFIPNEIIEVLRVGERANRLDTVLLKVADQLETRTHSQLHTMAKLIEPALMVLMAIVIGFLMMALLMPVFLSSGRFN